MTKKEGILDCLIDDDEARTQILEYFELDNTKISEVELDTLLNELMNEGLISVNFSWKNEKGEYPYSLTKKGREIWESIPDED